MRTHRLAFSAVALMASTILISCSSDDDAPSDSGVPIVSDSTISSLPVADTTLSITTDSGG